jgi:hypothetical protein
MPLFLVYAISEKNVPKLCVGEGVSGGEVEIVKDNKKRVENDHVARGVRIWSEFCFLKSWLKDFPKTIGFPA